MKEIYSPGPQFVGFVALTEASFQNGGKQTLSHAFTLLFIQFMSNETSQLKGINSIV